MYVYKVSGKAALISILLPIILIVALAIAFAREGSVTGLIGFYRDLSDYYQFITVASLVFLAFMITTWTTPLVHYWTEGWVFRVDGDGVVYTPQNKFSVSEVIRIKMVNFPRARTFFWTRDHRKILVEHGLSGVNTEEMQAIIANILPNHR